MDRDRRQTRLAYQRVKGSEISKLVAHPGSWDIGDDKKSAKKVSQKSQSKKSG
jgi:hypothetical protein